MATLKSLSAAARRQVVAVVKVHRSSVFDCPAYRLHSTLVLRHVSQEATKTVRPSTSVLLPHHKDLNHQEPWTVDKNICINYAVSSPSNADDHRYICPSRLGQLFSQLVIMDNVTDIQSHYDCPVPNTVDISKVTPMPQNGKAEILEPLRGRYVTDSKEAKEIMRIRHKKMKKHKLRKLRKRMYFLWRKQKRERKAKRNAIFWKEISDIKKEAEDFSAETFVKEQLEKARKGGHYIKVMDSKL